MQRGGDGLEIATTLPGTAALRQILASLLSAGHSTQHVRAASKALDSFNAAVAEIAGSRASLVRLVATSATHATDNDDLVHETERARHSLFRGAADLIGRWSETQILLSLMRPVPGRPEEVEVVGVTGLIGHRSRGNAVPLVGNYGILMQQGAEAPTVSEVNFARQLTSAERLPERAGILKRFTSRSVLNCTVRPTEPGGRLLVIDTPASPDSPGIDVVNSSRVSGVPHPRLSDDPVCGATVRIRYPAERLVFDAYLHRSMAKESVASVGAYSWDPRLGQDLAPVWYERMPSPLSLTLLGNGIENAATRAWARHAELTRYVFEGLGWDPAEFVGHRIEQPYPIWSAHYTMNFDFRPC